MAFIFLNPLILFLIKHSCYNMLFKYLTQFILITFFLYWSILSRMCQPFICYSLLSTVSILFNKIVPALFFPKQHNTFFPKMTSFWLLITKIIIIIIPNCQYQFLFLLHLTLPHFFQLPPIILAQWSLSISHPLPLPFLKMHEWKMVKTFQTSSSSNHWFLLSNF